MKRHHRLVALVAVYAITPGGGAISAEAHVNERTGEVTIHTYWS